MAAMFRAAERARRIAAQTHTALVVERNGIVECLYATQAQSSTLFVDSQLAAAVKKDR